MKKNKKINLKKSDIIRPVISALASALLFLNAPAYSISLLFGVAVASILNIYIIDIKASHEFPSWGEKFLINSAAGLGVYFFASTAFNIGILEGFVSAASYVSGIASTTALLNLYIKTFSSNEENEPVVEEIEKENQVIEEKENNKETKEKSKELSIQEKIELCNEYKNQLLNTDNELEEEKTYTKKY